MKLGINLQNIADNDGLAVSITGMTIVFLGLLFVSVFIALLPRILDQMDRLLAWKSGQDPADEASEIIDETIDEEIAAAITMVLEHAMTPEDGSAFQRITIRRTPTDSVWKQAGLLRRLSTQLPAIKERR